MIQGMYAGKGLVDPFHFEQDITHERSFDHVCIGQNLVVARSELLGNKGCCQGIAQEGGAFLGNAANGVTFIRTVQP
jgi:hypothetical protein